MKKKFKDLFKVNKESIREVLLWLIGGLFLLFITEFLLRGKIRYVKLLLLNKPGVFLVNFLLNVFFSLGVKLTLMLQILLTLNYYTVQ